VVRPWMEFSAPVLSAMASEADDAPMDHLFY
jgi:hypothetical protein